MEQRVQKPFISHMNDFSLNDRMTLRCIEVVLNDSSSLSNPRCISTQGSSNFKSHVSLFSALTCQCGTEAQRQLYCFYDLLIKTKIFDQM